MDLNEITNNPKASNRMKANALSKIPGSLYNLEEYTVDKVVSIFKRAIELDPKNEDVHVARVALLPRIGCFIEFDGDSEIAIKLNENNKGAFIYKAFHEYLLNLNTIMLRYAGAIQMGVDKIVHMPPEVKIQCEIEARKCYEPLLKKYNDLAKPFGQFAKVMHELENYKEAAKYYKLAIDREPKNGEFYAKLGFNYMMWKPDDYETPFKILTDAIKVDNTCQEIFKIFSILEMQNGKYQHAAELCNKAIDLSGDSDNESTLVICSTLIVAQIQQKMIQKFGKISEYLKPF